MAGKVLGNFSGGRNGMKRLFILCLLFVGLTVGLAAGGPTYTTIRDVFDSWIGNQVWETYGHFDGRRIQGDYSLTYDTSSKGHEQWVTFYYTYNGEIVRWRSKGWDLDALAD